MTENSNLSTRGAPDGVNTVPVFVAPVAPGPNSPAGSSTTPAAVSPVTHQPAEEPEVKWGDDQVVVLDGRPMPRDLHDVPVTRRQVVSALCSNDRINVSERAAYVITYSATPNSWAPLREAARHNMLQPRRPSAMRISEVEADVLLPTLLVGPQPRTETDPSPVAPPRVSGELEGGVPVAEYVMEFRNQQHVEDWVREIVKSTDKQGGEYQSSIIEKGVSEPVTAAPVRIVLADRGDGQSDSFTALMVFDGITRVVRSWQVHLGFTVKIDEVADTIVRNTVVPTERRATSGKSLHEKVLETRNAAVASWRGTHANSKIEGVGLAAAEAGIRTAQAFTVRARIVVGCETASTCRLNLDDQFPDAVAELVRFTQENKAWRQEASAANAMHGVVRSLKGHGDVDSSEMADFLLGSIASNEIASSTAAALETDAALTPSLAALYRGVFVLWFFTRPGVFHRSKADLRTSLNAGAIRHNRYAHTLAPLVEAPWRLHKASSLPQARNAYKRRGALTDAAMSEGWVIDVDDPMALYRKAVGGDEGARITLMTAGGIALIADRFLTTEVVAGVGSGGEYTAPWRARSIAEVISLLGHPENKRGLLQLALAMREFSIDKEAANGMPRLERQRRSSTESSRLYVMHGAADDLLDTHADGIQREGGSEVELTTQLILLIADFDDSRRDKNRRSTGSTNAKTRPLTLQQLADEFVARMRSTSERGTQLIERGGQDSSRVIVDGATQQEIGKLHRRLSAVLDWIDERADKEPTAWGDELDDMEHEDLDDLEAADEADDFGEDDQ